MDIVASVGKLSGCLSTNTLSDVAVSSENVVPHLTTTYSSVSFRQFNSKAGVGSSAMENNLSVTATLFVGYFMHTITIPICLE